MATEPDTQGLLFQVEKPERHAASYEAMRRMEPLSRDSDSLGSFLAGDRLAKSGLGGQRRLAVYHALREHQGTTSAELAQAAGLDRHDVARRLPELERAGWATRGRVRTCHVCRVPCLTWYVVRTWADGQRPAVPRQREPQAAPTATTDGRTPAARPVSGSASMAGLRHIPGNVTSVAERRRLRQRLAAEGPDHVRRFLREAGRRIDGHGSDVESKGGGVE